MTGNIQQLWSIAKFTPTAQQRDAIQYGSGPLFLTAGPGSGKTRVLLWRTLNLIVYQSVPPEAIFLSTFTEKAAFQLQQGLRTLLGIASNQTGRPYDISKMYVGTVHSLCQKILLDRQFSGDRRRGIVPAVFDAVGQYFFMYRRLNWEAMLKAGKVAGNEQLNALFDGRPSKSRHAAVSQCISLFNRFSEECIDPVDAIRRTSDKGLKKLLSMYSAYRDLLKRDPVRQYVDLSLLQQLAFERLKRFNGAETIFQHVIVDEFQDTNAIQEKLFFLLACGHKNICVVGDDDQALYRFRGATVENFVNFRDRCKEALGRFPKRIPLERNFRSRKGIVSCFTAFVNTCDWRKRGGGHYRVMEKRIEAHRTDTLPSVAVSSNDKPEKVATEIAQLVKRLLAAGKVSDPNQIAFLFPTLEGKMSRCMKAALKFKGLDVYAPRAGRFLDVPESLAVFGVLLRIFGSPPEGHFPGRDHAAFTKWIQDCESSAIALLAGDQDLYRFIERLKTDLAKITADYERLTSVAKKKGWSLDSKFDPNTRAILARATGLSNSAVHTLMSPYMERLILRRQDTGRPFTLQYVLTTATSVDWSVLDVFYQLMGFKHFRCLFDLAEKGKDEGPVCNLALITEYLARFMDQYSPMITGRFLADDMFKKVFFGSYLYALYRLGESEFEDSDDPFPKGRIPFLTIHQAKGLEFPIVVLGSPRKKDNGPQQIESMVRPLLARKLEPLDRCTEFDIMRMFYVSLSRAQNLLVIAHPRGRGISTHRGIESIIQSHCTPLTKLDTAILPEFKPESSDLPKSYSYTSDYLQYEKCARNYMVFRRYGFVASRSQTQFFGSLVHKTIEDLHHLLIAKRSEGAP
jgi:DNA helicase-2/ATP-dependent DNA helicase PcrA